MRIKKRFLHEQGVFASLRILDSDLTNDPSSIVNVALYFPHPELEEAILIVQRCVLVQ